MPEPSVMRFDEGFDRGIRCRFISEWFRMDSYVPGKENLLIKIKNTIIRVLRPQPRPYDEGTANSV
jgi:hypothetical protein